MNSSSNAAVVVDDSIFVPVYGNQTAVPRIVYEPVETWRLNTMCGGCNVTGEDGLAALRATVYAGE